MHGIIYIGTAGNTAVTVTVTYRVRFTVSNAPTLDIEVSLPG